MKLSLDALVLLDAIDRRGSFAGGCRRIAPRSVGGHLSGAQARAGSRSRGVRPARPSRRAHPGGSRVARRRPPAAARRRGTRASRPPRGDRVGNRTRHRRRRAGPDRAPVAAGRRVLRALPGPRGGTYAPAAVARGPRRRLGCAGRPPRRPRRRRHRRPASGRGLPHPAAGRGRDGLRGRALAPAGGRDRAGAGVRHRRAPRRGRRRLVALAAAADAGAAGGAGHADGARPRDQGRGAGRRPGLRLPAACITRRRSWRPGGWWRRRSTCRARRCGWSRRGGRRSRARRSRGGSTRCRAPTGRSGRRPRERRSASPTAARRAR